MPKSLAVAPLLAALLLSTSPLAAQTERSTPLAVAIAETIPAARDLPYPGTIDLEIDATDVVRGLFRVTETIPVKPGASDLVLLLPQWLPGNHSPTVKAPAGWTVYTALDGHAVSGQTHTWAATDYDTLVDSPIFAGRYAQRSDIGHGMWMDAIADKPGLLAITPEHMRTYRNLTDEA